MSTLTDILEKMRKNPAGVRFADICKICNHYFGQARQVNGSHRVYKTPWSGDPRVNIQNSKGYSKAYQVKQIIKAIERLEAEHGAEK
ncbi:MAG: toxin HicA [Deltaproteobacteria bacterium]|nr:toxin HicA [Deltaproteobacteria bacterium]